MSYFFIVDEIKMDLPEVAFVTDVDGLKTVLTLAYHKFAKISYCGLLMHRALA
jgi:hypothetical protein